MGPSLQAGGTLARGLIPLPLPPPAAVEAAEEKLVDATEQAINLMRSVLENPDPIKHLHALLVAQQQFYAEASECLQSVLGEVEEAGTAAEADWR